MRRKGIVRDNPWGRWARLETNQRKGFEKKERGREMAEQEGQGNERKTRR